MYPAGLDGCIGPWKARKNLKHTNNHDAQGYGLSDTCKHGSTALLALLRVVDGFVISERANDAFERGALTLKSIPVPIWTSSAPSFCCCAPWTGSPSASTPTTTSSTLRRNRHKVIVEFHTLLRLHCCTPWTASSSASTPMAPAGCATLEIPTQDLPVTLAVHCTSTTCL